MWRKLPDYLKPVCEFANLTGWRKGEILSLEWREVDFEIGCIRLDGEKTKNGEARTIYMTARLREVLKAQRVNTDELQRLRGRIIRNVFHRNGKPIGSFYKAWRTACKEAVVPGMLLHDFRRTHVRRLVRAGVSERVAMQQTGHLSRAVFERYNIVNDADLRDAKEKLEQLQFSYNQQTKDDNKVAK